MVKANTSYRVPGRWGNKKTIRAGPRFKKRKPFPRERKALSEARQERPDPVNVSSISEDADESGQDDDDDADQEQVQWSDDAAHPHPCLLYTSPSPRDLSTSRMPSSA